MIDVVSYFAEKYKEWDTFIDASKNGTLMLKRGYVEYHSDRFTDFSLMFYDEGKLVAAMPASLHGDEVRSHGGLTYGGIISDRKMTTKKMRSVFDALTSYLKENVKKLIYKCIPSVYHTYPADEDLYVLFRKEAKPVRRDMFAFDFLGNELISNFFEDKIWFDFGISTGNGGMMLNEGLCQQMETFGGRSIVYDFYELEIK